jgi:hypothetical protein
MYISEYKEQILLEHEMIFLFNESANFVSYFSKKFSKNFLLSFEDCKIIIIEQSTARFRNIIQFNTKNIF